MSRSGAVYQVYPADDIPPPFVAFEVSNNVPSFGADDMEKTSEITVTVDSVHRDNAILTAVMLDINRIMTGIGYVRDSYGPLMQNGGAYSRMIRFKIEMED